MDVLKKLQFFFLIIVIVSCAKSNFIKFPPGTQLNDVRKAYSENGCLFSGPENLILTFKDGEDTYFYEFTEKGLVNQGLANNKIKGYLDGKGLNSPGHDRLKQNFIVANRLRKYGYKDDAFNLLKNQVKNNSKNAMAYTHLSILYMKDGQYEKAIENNQIGLKNVSNKMDMKINSIPAFIAAKEFDKAEQYSIELLNEKDSNKSIIHYNLACVYSLQNKIEAALKSLELAIKSNPKGLTKKMVLRDPELNNIKANPVFEKLISGLP